MDRGSIPACAGEPAPPLASPCVIGVHPRVCGGAIRKDGAGRAGEGPSPRVRGSLGPDTFDQDIFGSIPACAGEPRQSTREARRSGVHPRVCGGAGVALLLGDLLEGPSPRVRGSPVFPVAFAAARGSIPACAGEPIRIGSPMASIGVHPRVCGGATRRRLGSSSMRGPSPRVRGSRRELGGAPRSAGSIPACAGEPRSTSRYVSFKGIHPRVCGGACFGVVSLDALPGPSPRVRGSQPDERTRPSA